ncbi:unnamed protein product, partial [Hapterophycus canaliculatus]
RRNTVIDLERWPGGAITIYFGSQTGTAECFAQIVAAEGVGHGFKTTVVDLEDFHEKELASVEKAVFIMATYGDGDPTDNANAFYNWVANKEGDLSSEHLKKLNYTVFGLGNTQYEHFNLAGRTIYQDLQKLGAQRMFEYGEGDDDDQLEEDFEAWKENMWTAL